MRSLRREGKAFDIDGNFTTAPSFSPDGSKVTFLSNKGSEYSRTSLYIADSDGGRIFRRKDNRVEGDLVVGFRV